MFGTSTLSGPDREPDAECRGGTMHPPDNFNSRSVQIKGISGSGLEVQLYAAQGCEDIPVWTTQVDECISPSEGVSSSWIRFDPS